MQVGDIIKLVDLWDGNYDFREIVDSEVYYSYDDEKYYEFIVVNDSNYDDEVLVKIVDIY